MDEFKQRLQKENQKSGEKYEKFMSIPSPKLDDLHALQLKSKKVPQVADQAHIPECLRTGRGWNPAQLSSEKPKTLEQKSMQQIVTQNLALKDKPKAQDLQVTEFDYPLENTIAGDRNAKGISARSQDDREAKKSQGLQSMNLNKPLDLAYIPEFHQTEKGWKTTQ